MTTTIYRNDTTGYTVTLIDNGRGGARVTDSLNYDFPMVGSDYPFAATLAKSRAHLNGAVEVPAAPAAQMTSPLPVDLQVKSSRPLVANVIGLPTLPQARCLNWSVGDDAAMPVRPVARGFASVDGHTAPMPVLIAMARRGWFELDHPIRPTYGRATQAGHLALLAYVTKNGEVQ
jgi:hypothetical protein